MARIAAAKAAGDGSGWRPPPGRTGQLVLQVHPVRAGQVGRRELRPTRRPAEGPAHVGQHRRLSAASSAASSAGSISTSELIAGHLCPLERQRLELRRRATARVIRRR
jgi:hypothetical protein